MPPTQRQQAEEGAEDFEDEVTGETDTPIVKLEKRTRRLRHDHQVLSSKVDKVDTKVEVLDGKVDSVIDHVGNLREVSAGNSAKLDMLVGLKNAKDKVATEFKVQSVRTMWKLITRVGLILLGLAALVATHYITFRLGH